MCPQPIALWRSQTSKRPRGTTASAFPKPTGINSSASSAHRLACEECRDSRVEAPGSRSREHHDGQADAVERFRDVEQIAEQISTVNRLPCADALDDVECKGPTTNHEEPERRQYGQEADDKCAAPAE